MSSWTPQEWIFAIVVGLAVFGVLFFNREKIKNLVGGGKSGGSQPKKRRN